MTEKPIAEQDLRKGDRIRVTREGQAGGVSQWDGVVVTADPEHGFLLDGHRVHDGRPERSWFATAESLHRWAGCVQTLTRLAV